ncbi:CATRA conflict system CASPASE/TPR repeat-associated protein [Yinghuangia seranimata]|uniref:CATRA conflict system CASPASE/TPR repeat-associated protein n=1 Tax=Yinghuangia seranimata TaxID=408067 RepID=UPI00248B9398|nr:CATRA conflict system CASPASE/TPR repeat-associated protein [Yinghuangia seranimata]MDI2129429.1 BN6_48550 family protein [Yinghuangia seranimata]
MPAFVKPALLLACFAPKPTGADASDTRYLAAVWAGAQRWGMTETIRGLPGPCGVFPEVPEHDTGFMILSAATAPASRGFGSGFVFVEHDFVGVVILLAPPDDGTGLAQWPRLRDEWEQALTAEGPAPERGETLHEFRLYQALFGPESAGWADQSDAVRQHASSPADGEWSTGCDVSAEDFRVWTPPQDGDVVSVTDLYILAPVQETRTLNAWLWTLPDQHGLRPLARYLLQVAKLRYERRLYARSVPTYRSWAERCEREAAELLHEIDTAAGPVPLERARNAAMILDRMQFGEHGLMWMTTRRRELSRTVVTCAADMRLYEPTLHRHGPGVAWPAAELEGVALLLDRLETDGIHMEATRERVEGARTMAAAIAGRALADHRNRLRIVQTSVLGALVTALTAIQAFGYRVPVPGPLQAPLILFLAAIALVLPLWILRSAAGTAASAAYPWLDSCAAGVLGAAVAWLTAAAAGPHDPGAAVPAALTAPCTAAGALLGCLIDRRLRPRPRGLTTTGGGP